MLNAVLLLDTIIKVCYPNLWDSNLNRLLGKPSFVCWCVCACVYILFSKIESHGIYIWKLY